MISPLVAAGVAVLRLATSAPEGSSWAHELSAMGREIETATHGELRVKWYWGGIAGAENQVGERMKRGQLDGTASGGVLCAEAAPTLRVLAVRGLFHSREEAAHVMTRLRPTIEEEARASGYEYVGATGLGPDLVFSRRPIHTWEELRALKLWHWDIDTPGRIMADALGLVVAESPIEEAGRLYDEGRVDGFISAPAGAVAFQWFTRARYLLTQPLGFDWGCLMITTRSFARLPHEQQEIVRGAASKVAVRIDDMGRQQDAALLGGLFQKQGLTPITGSDTLRRDFLAAARAAREKLGDRLVAPQVLGRVLAMLADYRAEHEEQK